MFSKNLFRILGAAVSLVPAGMFAQGSPAAIEPRGAARPANADGMYETMRSSLPAGDGVKVKDFTIERQGGIFHFTEGSFYLYSGVNGRVTGAVYVGAGGFALSPKDASEAHSLSLLTKSGAMTQNFTTLVLRFTDDTAEEIQKSSAGGVGATPKEVVQAAADTAKGFRQKLDENFELRLLSDVLTVKAGSGRFFLASFRMGGTFLGKNVLFVVDPEGSPNAAPDQVELDTWDDEGAETWAAYRMEGIQDDAGVPLRVTSETLNVEFQRSGEMKSSAQTTFIVRREGLRVVALNLYPTLRVSGVYSESGDPLDFVQENKDYDAQFAVLLPKGAKAGETIRLLTKYSGKDAVTRDGDGMYYLKPSARESWYPAGKEGLGEFADFRMTFHVPKGLQIVATGKEISRDAEPGGGTRAVWATQSPIPVAGFNLGNFKSAEQKTPQGFTVSAYANEDLPDSIKSYVDQLNLGTMTTVSALKFEVSQGAAAIQVYSDFFGKLPYDHVALTEQSACGFGQSWPMLVYLPICGFWDSTIQHRLGLLDQDPSYWKEVTPHEVAHQWWGQMVGFNSYRDQWMSEGFANFSVGLYLVATNKTMDDSHDFWKEQRRNLLQKNAQGVRPIDVGPLTMGERVSNEKTGNVYQDLIYSKGAFVMHMLQMMYWTPEQKDAPFKDSMQKFVAEYNGKSATTEDLKVSFEKSMPKWMDLHRDGKLDWFFNEYVYGTELPHYDISSEFTTDNGEVSVHFKVTQSNVSPDFLMRVPLYMQMADGRTLRVLDLVLHGNMVSEHTVKLGKPPSPPKKMLLNYNEDVLSD